MKKFFLIAISQFLALVVGMGIAIYQLKVVNKEVPAPRVYNAHWQQTQNAKMVACYQKMPTQEEVNGCLIALKVFI